MSLYESVLIARQEISTQQVDALVDTFESVIKDNGGSVEKRENWGLRSLAYKIKKNRKGHYVLFNIDAPAEAMHEMERLMRLNEDVLRHLTLRVDEFEEGPSVQAQVRSSRDDRPARNYDNKPAETEAKAAPEAKTEAKTEAKPEADAAPEVKAETKEEPKAEGKK
jgi:small subunit ribosomal protein S6